MFPPAGGLNAQQIYRMSENTCLMHDTSGIALSRPVSNIASSVVVVNVVENIFFLFYALESVAWSGVLKSEENILTDF